MGIDKLQGGTMKKLIIIITILLLTVSFAHADEALIVPFTFENGQVADAEQMNQMFQAIQEHLNKPLVVPFDYGTPDGSSKVFQQTASPTTLTAVTVVGNVETWTYSDNSRVEHITAEGVDGTMLKGRREYNTTGVMTQDLTYYPSVLGVDITGVKAIGTVWGNAYIAKKPDGSQYGAETNLYTVIGIEDVTVPAGLFRDCIKIHITTQNYKSVGWYATGVGLVKRIGVQGLMELQ
jgi:hypothetical protein